MSVATPETIKEIAEQLSCGFSAYIHKSTGQMLFVPDEMQFPDMDTDVWAEEFKQLESNGSDFFEVEKWTSSDAFEVMREFAEQVPDRKLQEQLIEALGNRKPFRHFGNLIDYSGDFRQQWFDFRSKWQNDYVARQLEVLSATD